MHTTVERRINSAKYWDQLLLLFPSIQILRSEVWAWIFPCHYFRLSSAAQQFLYPSNITYNSYCNPRVNTARVVSLSQKSLFLAGRLRTTESSKKYCRILLRFILVLRMKVVQCFEMWWSWLGNFHRVFIWISCDKLCGLHIWHFSIYCIDKFIFILSFECVDALALFEW